MEAQYDIAAKAEAVAAKLEQCGTYKMHGGTWRFCSGRLMDRVRHRDVIDALEKAIGEANVEALDPGRRPNQVGVLKEALMRAGVHMKDGTNPTGLYAAGDGVGEDGSVITVTDAGQRHKKSKGGVYLQWK